MKWAIYRIHYGLNFLKQSIDSIKDSVDRVFVIYSLDPWVKEYTINYLGEIFVMPVLHENVSEFMKWKYGEDKKIEYWRAEIPSPKNQFRQLYEMVCEKMEGVPEHVLFMEPDMVFYKPDVEKLFNELETRDLPCLGTLQIELWKNFEWRIPLRDRIGPMIWSPQRYHTWETHFGTYQDNMQIISEDILNYNFGFCLDEKTMLYKHLTAINFSKVIGDSIPSQEWYRDKWLNWTPETTDIEIAERWKHTIPRAVIYNMTEKMKDQMNAPR